MTYPENSLLCITKQLKRLSPDTCLPSLPPRQIILPESENCDSPFLHPCFLFTYLTSSCWLTFVTQLIYRDRDGVKGEERKQSKPILPNHLFVIRGVLCCADSVLQHVVPKGTQIAHPGMPSLLCLRTRYILFFASYLWHLSGVCPFELPFK